MRNSILKRHLRAHRPSSFVCAALAIIFVSTLARAENEKPASATKHPLTPAIKLAKSSRDALGQVQDYVAIFQKKERVGGRMISHKMAIKQRREPFSVYLRFIGEHDGREVIYVEGANNGKLLAHETGLAGIVGTIPLIPTSPEAMSESIHPITDIGMWNLVDKVIEGWEKATTVPDEVQLKYYPNAKLADKTECKVIETTHPNRRPESTSYRTRLYIEKKTNFPIRVEHYGFPRESGAEPPILGEYQYTNIRVNQNLSDLDFDQRNPQYGF
jgi:hypothetical protein